MHPDPASAAPTPRPLPDLVRLTEEDAPFWLLHRALGWSVVQQMVWVFPVGIGDPALRQFNDALALGRLHRRLVDSRVPGARPYWVRASQPVPLAVDEVRIDDEQVSSWAVEELREVDLDPEAGRCWRLRAASTASGGTVLSLCTLHLVADGSARIKAVVEALAVSGTGRRAVPALSTPPVAPLQADLLDSARQVAAAARGVSRVIGRRVRRDAGATAVDPRPARPPLAERAPAATPVWATATVTAEAWDAVASRHGGTANSLFVAVVTGLLRAGGYTAPENTVKVGLPVSDRTGDDDERGNAVAGVTLYLTPVPSPASDLRPIREASRNAFEELAIGRRAAAAHLRPLAWLVPPHRLAGLGASDSAYPDAVASNVGVLPPELLVIGGVVASDVTVRGVAQGVDPNARHRYGDGVQAWLTRTGTDATFTVAGFDETRFVDGETLEKLLAAELSDWGLPARIW
ncbi:hypothetical protein [Gordonia sp. NPDC058843]|uniref:hypothetical protein n=1 Tax=Gordonia sp. NPDC058843 TaxID=3346648 RepID=UPI0036C47DAB